MSRYLPPADYLPHEAPMVLLEEVIAVSDERAHCRVTVNRHGVLAPFITAEGDLPGWFALELMAQTVGVWSGWHRHQSGQQTITLGMVLGARELVCAPGYFPSGDTLDIDVRLLMQDDRFASFECQIRSAKGHEATGRVNTFQPTAEELASLFTQGEKQ